jgi:hypothetical protein
VKGEKPVGKASSTTQEKRNSHLAPSAKCQTAIDIIFIALALLIIQAPALMAQTGGGATLVGTVKTLPEPSSPAPKSRS